MKYLEQTMALLNLLISLKWDFDPRNNLNLIFSDMWSLNIIDDGHKILPI